ncbi:MAG: altronate hydrolase protein [Roseomonas sp.]|nr:altronate hydrolase protein [Roseomonas sp.]
MHEHNVAIHDFGRDYAFASEVRDDQSLRPGEAPAHFQGFRRAGGKAGTRNYIGILSPVNCSATVIDFIADGVARSGILAD